MKTKTQGMVMHSYTMHHHYYDAYQDQTIDSDIATYSYPAPTSDRMFSRDWENAQPLKRVKRVKRYQLGPWKVIPVIVRRGPRLPIKVWVPRLKKYVWARKPIRIYKVVRERTLVKEKKRSLKGSYLPPNYLLYKECNVSWSGDESNSYSYETDLNLYGGATAHLEWTYSGCPWLTGVGAPVTGHQILPDLISWENSNVFSLAPSAAAEELLSLNRTIAINRIYDKVKDQKANAAQMLAERGQTAQLFKDLCKRLFLSILQLKRGNLFAAARKLFPTDSKELANDWLQLQYGLKPLISDIQGLAEHLSDDGHFLSDLIGRKKGTTVYSTTRTLMSGFATDTIVIEVEATAKYKATIDVGSSESKMAQHLLDQLGFTSWLALGWELVPWSFVFDWALPLGDYLSQHDAFQYVTTTDAAETSFIREKVFLSRVFDISRYQTETAGTTPSTTGAVQCTGASDISIISEKVYCKRQPTGSWLPELQFPDLKDPVSLGHTLNALALLRQLK